MGGASSWAVPPADAGNVRGSGREWKALHPGPKTTGEMQGHEKEHFRIKIGPGMYFVLMFVVRANVSAC